MKVVVVGGTGLIGSKVVAVPGEHGHTSTTNLLEAEADAGVTRHVALAVVGTERLQGSGCFRAKQAQEELIRASGVPYSIVHATRFFEFVNSIAAEATHGDTVRPAPLEIRPVHSDDMTTLLPGPDAHIAGTRFADWRARQRV